MVEALYMHTYAPNFMSDSNQFLPKEPITISEGILQQDIFCNDHLIPKDATYTVQEKQDE